MKLGILCVLAASACATLVVACGDDDIPQDEPHAQDASVPTQDATLPVADAKADGDAADAGTPLQRCEGCIFNGCGPALVGCLVDPDCRTLITCVVESNCFDDLPACVGSCIEKVGETDVLAEVLKLKDIADKCSSCASTCQNAVGVDAGLGGGFGGGFP